MIKNSTNKLYVGITDNPNQRLQEHNTARGAAYTAKIPTFEIVFLEEYEARNMARAREVQIKKWRRDKKERLIQMYKAGLRTRLA